MSLLKISGSIWIVVNMDGIFYLITTEKLHLVTWQSIITDALKLGIVDSLLEHSQKNYPTDPELDSQQVSPVAGRQGKPEHSKQHINDAHHHVELIMCWENKLVFKTEKHN